MGENNVMPLTTHKEVTVMENYIVFQDSKPVSHQNGECTSTWNPAAVYLISTILETRFMKNDGDSASLVCFEATDSHQLQCKSAVFICVGECLSGEEYFPVELEETEVFAGFSYHVNDVFECNIRNLNAMITTRNKDGSVLNLKYGLSISKLRLLKLKTNI
ncbi:unnamed protein product [Mytilus coruscus]|uniref:Uncharacterized protein n=1 Tax=Mytilus coruscus TaxID=42192 RepID=A0A6J8EC38_MYTCO|nr:unnamed protein product [Mytilus coruscus]